VKAGEGDRTVREDVGIEHRRADPPPEGGPDGDECVDNLFQCRRDEETGRVLIKGTVDIIRHAVLGRVNATTHGLELVSGDKCRAVPTRLVTWTEAGGGLPGVRGGELTICIVLQILSDECERLSMDVRPCKITPSGVLRRARLRGGRPLNARGVGGRTGIAAQDEREKSGRE